MKAKLTAIALTVGALVVGDATSWHFGIFALPISFVADAEARVGRPFTPGSVAGVARRTTRRVVRRSTIYVASLPAGCVVTSIDGVNYWRCGATYYGTYGSQYVVVYID